VLFYKTKTGHILLAQYYGHPQKHTEFSRCVQLLAELPVTQNHPLAYIAQYMQYILQA